MIIFDLFLLSILSNFELKTLSIALDVSTPKINEEVSMKFSENEPVPHPKSRIEQF